MTRTLLKSNRVYRLQLGSRRRNPLRKLQLLWRRTRAPRYFTVTPD